MTSLICTKCGKSISASDNGSSLFSIMLCDACLRASLDSPTNRPEDSKRKIECTQYEKPRFSKVLSFLANSTLALCLFFFFSQVLLGSKDVGFGMTSLHISLIMLVGGVIQYIIFEGISKALIYLSQIEKNTRR